MTSRGLSLSSFHFIYFLFNLPYPIHKHEEDFYVYFCKPKCILYYVLLIQGKFCVHTYLLTKMAYLSPLPVS